MSEAMTYDEYWDEVRELGREAERMVRDGESGDVFEAAWELCNSHHWVTYTAFNFDVLRHCSNANAYADECGGDGIGIVDGGRVRFDRLAYAALVNDVSEAVAVGR